VSKSKFINFFVFFDLGIADRADVHEKGTRVAKLVVMAGFKIAILLTVPALAACS
jgi:hypothetical protein